MNFQFLKKKTYKKKKNYLINYFHKTRISPQIVRLFQQVLTFLLYLFIFYSRQHFAAPIKIDLLHYKKKIKLFHNANYVSIMHEDTALTSAAWIYDAPQVHRSF